MDLNYGTHISWWPQYDSDGYFTFNAFPNQLLKDDVTFEGKQPDHVIELNNLDETAIQKWWDDFRKDHKWNYFSQNCASTAGEALDAGGARNKAPDFSEPLIWTPADFYNYLQALQRAEQGH